MTSQKRPILLAVNAIDEQSRQAIAEVGGRVERATWTGDEDELAVLLIVLPTEKTELFKTYDGRTDITLRPDENLEIVLQLDSAGTVNIENAEIEFIDRIEYKDDNE